MNIGVAQNTLHTTLYQVWNLYIHVDLGAVTYLLDTAAGYHNSVTLSLCSMLSHNKLSICCVLELYCPPMCLEDQPLPGHRSRSFWQGAGPKCKPPHVAVWKHRSPELAHRTFFPRLWAVLVDAPSRLTCHGRARWRRLQIGCTY